MPALRLRKTLVSDVVQQCDAFAKVVDDVKEEKRTTGGLITAISAAVIVFLVLGELRFYFFDEIDPEYKFTVDVDFDEKLNVDVDMVVATACDRIGADMSGTVISDERHLLGGQNQLKMNPTRFEFTDRELYYWEVLRQSHKENFAPGRRKQRAIDQMTYVSSSVLKGLQSAAEEKQQAEAAALSANAPKKGRHPGGNVIFMMGNGMGFLQIISDDSSNGNQGTACRIHGSIPIHKVSGTIHIGLGKSVSFGGGAHAHFAGFGVQEGNFSHRIEKLNFGRPVTGLITPLVGSEQISNSNADLYNYYINIVPTKIFHRGMFSQSTITYQYAKRTVDHASGSHGMPGITIKYEFSSLVIEVRDGDRSLISLLLRLCAVVGGVFATSTILNGIFNLLVSWYYDGKTRKQPELKQPLVNGLPSAKNHHLPYSVPVEM